ncbi:hypothetical protein BX611_1154 [Lutibacter oceani]|uniref:Uncharacterized protein n=1 Tax=Lutibacter oceani TaxID=1853311 RepID=A0A3D9RNZ5_9FLAO|nr:hypothetical protein [Lutibacter oceani]REE81619.1 hypothetical protein BX611_1154 [Lutibacter oceani]
MKIIQLKKHISEYKNSIKTVVEKKILWEKKTKKLLISTLNKIVSTYNIGWKVQELSWINTNEAVNITFHSFPPELIESTNKIPSYQFIQGASLVFSQSYNGDVNIFILHPIIDDLVENSNETDLSTYAPKNINEALIIEKVDEFLEKIISWEVPALKSKVGF